MPAVTITIDPLDQYKHAGPRQLLETGGLLLSWAVEYFHNQSSPTPGLLDHMAEDYRMPLFPVTGVAIENGVWLYEGDPPMHPYLHISGSGSNEKLAIFPYAFVVFFQGDELVLATRMD